MKEMEDNQPAYWSYTADHRFEPVKVITKQVYRLPEPPRSARPITTPISSSTSYAVSSWHMSDREVKRKKRVAAYKAYAVEGKVKASLRSSFRWVKNKYSSIVHGC